jgi:hypothetical protein
VLGPVPAQRHADELVLETTAAAISPTEWPMTAAGDTPLDRHSAARPTCIAKIMVCALAMSRKSPSPSACRGEKPISTAKTGSKVVDHRRERRLGEQFPPHARPLGTVSGEDPDQGGSGSGGPADDHAGVLLAGRQLAQAGRELVPAGGCHDRSFRQLRIPQRQRVSDLVQRGSCRHLPASRAADARSTGRDAADSGKSRYPRTVVS